MKIGLFFGSFNPIHIGHLAIANYMVEFSDLNQVWFVISPHNPLKTKNTLLANHLRLEMVQIALENNDNRFRVSNIEFGLPIPSYTINTLTHLKEKFSQHEFVIIMGADQLPTFHKWKNPEEIISSYCRYIYPRPGISEKEISTHKNIKLVDAPLFEISSSFIRQSIKEGKDVRYFLPEKVYLYINNMNLYK